MVTDGQFDALSPSQTVRTHKTVSQYPHIEGDPPGEAHAEVHVNGELIESGPATPILPRTTEQDAQGT